jgi:hypothetical protein
MDNLLHQKRAAGHLALGIGYATLAALVWFADFVPDALTIGRNCAIVAHSIKNLARHTSGWSTAELHRSRHSALATG